TDAERRPERRCWWPLVASTAAGRLLRTSIASFAWRFPQACWLVTPSSPICAFIDLHHPVLSPRGGAGSFPSSGSTGPFASIDRGGGLIPPEEPFGGELRLRPRAVARAGRGGDARGVIPQARPTHGRNLRSAGGGAVHGVDLRRRESRPPVRRLVLEPHSPATVPRRRRRRCLGQAQDHPADRQRRRPQGRRD